MKILLSPILIILIFFCGCTFTPEQKATASSVGSFVFQNALKYGMQLLANKVSGDDGGKKADLLDFFAFNIRSKEDTIKSGDDLKEAITEHAPDKSHWEVLGDKVSALFNGSKGPPAKNAEEVAAALNKAAELERKGK